MPASSQPEVVVVGGGIAALEFVLALRDLAGDRVAVTVSAPNRDFVARPLLVADPAAARRLPLERIAGDVGFKLVAATVAAVDPSDVRLRSGAAVAYDTLLLAPGARVLPAFDDAIHIGDPDSPAALAQLSADVRAGEVNRVAFVAPTLTGWLLPLYESALLTAGLSDRVRVSLVTAEEAPLALFGERASADVAAALEAAGVEFIGGRQARVSGRTVLAGQRALPADRVVSLPLVRGPRIPGVPATGVYGLIPVDAYGRVEGLASAYAAGDATTFPVKQGGIACRQAEAAAAHIAAGYGAPVTPEPFTPALRATLITGAGELALGGEPAGKLPGRYLAPYLGQTAAGTRVDTALKAATTVGSNCVPAQRASSASASSRGRPGR
jgi:sulfide:quinone oxidoreductase